TKNDNKKKDSRRNSTPKEKLDTESDEIPPKRLNSTPKEKRDTESDEIKTALKVTKFLNEVTKKLSPKKEATKIHRLKRPNPII
ncbi:25070_t:CDS:1, partial [Dentiscutata erythropus]